MPKAQGSVLRIPSHMTCHLCGKQHEGAYLTAYVTGVAPPTGWVVVVLCADCAARNYRERGVSERNGARPPLP